MTVTDKKTDALARTLWGEARGEGLAGMVVISRKRRGKASTQPRKTKTRCVLKRFRRWVLVKKIKHSPSIHALAQ